MKPIIVLALLLGSVYCAKAQRTIPVEDLKLPTELLKTNSYQTVLEDMMRSDNSPAFNIVAKSTVSDNLVNFGYHSFFEGMYNAYAQHRPFCISPDMMWLLICQGFSHHVNNNADSLRRYFVNFKGKTSLIVKDQRILLDDPNSPWDKAFNAFGSQISGYTGKALTNTLTANFSTTTPITRVASQITLMDAMSSYFDFIVIHIGCGIPTITLKGTTKDWQGVLTKTETLRKYKLDWWVNEMEPVLKNIIAASGGKVDKPFWQGMFKYHSSKGCGAPNLVDGWIVKFFPYDKTGKKNDLKTISLKNVLPNEIVKVNLEYLNGDGNGNFVKTPLELWAGFVGLKQNSKTMELEPEIGWMIRKREIGLNPIIKDKLYVANNAPGGIMLSAENIPRELFEIGPIHSLNIFFTNGIRLPDDISKIKIDRFEMHGEITQQEIANIRSLLPNTDLVINQDEYGPANKK